MKYSGICIQDEFLISFLLFPQNVGNFWELRQMVSQKRKGKKMVKGCHSFISVLCWFFVVESFHGYELRLGYTAVNNTNMIFMFYPLSGRCLFSMPCLNKLQIFYGWHRGHSFCFGVWGWRITIIFLAHLSFSVTPLQWDINVNISLLPGKGV